MLKKCTDCEEYKELSAFNKNRAKKDGLGTKCRDCMKIYRKNHYQNNKDSYIADIMVRRRARKKIVVEKLLQYFLDNPCVDCGISDPRVLEFDHRDPAEKSRNVSEMLGGDWNWEVTLEEISKCDVRCANCHRIRTANQFNTYRSYWNCDIDVEAA
jgi:hypothetical protein